MSGFFSSVFQGVDGDEDGDAVLPPLKAYPFNPVMRLCSDVVADPADLVDPVPFVGPPAPVDPVVPADPLAPDPLADVDFCLPDPDVVYSVDRVGGIRERLEADFSPEYMDGPDGPYDASPHVDRIEARVLRVLASRREASDREVAKIAQMQADVESMMAVVEEFYGCVAIPDGGDLDRDPEAPYCTTNEGKGVGDTLPSGELGTVGLLDDLSVKLETIARQPDGNASMNQLGVLQTRTGMYVARAQAVLAQGRASELEREAQERLRAEASERRMYEVYNLTLECQSENDSPFYRFVPDVDRAALNVDDGGAPLTIADGQCVGNGMSLEAPNVAQLAALGPLDGNRPVQLNIPGAGLNTFRGGRDSDPLSIQRGSVGVPAGRSFRGFVDDVLRVVWE